MMNLTVDKPEPLELANFLGDNVFPTNTQSVGDKPFEDDVIENLEINNLDNLESD